MYHCYLFLYCPHAFCFTSLVFSYVDLEEVISLTTILLQTFYVVQAILLLILLIHSWCFYSVNQWTDHQVFYSVVIDPSSLRGPQSSQVFCRSFNRQRRKFLFRPPSSTEVCIFFNPVLKIWSHTSRWKVSWLKKWVKN